MSEHFDKCRANVLDYADHLIKTVKAGKLNGSAYEGLIESYLKAPAFADDDARRELYRLAYERFHGFSPSQAHVVWLKQRWKPANPQRFKTSIGPHS